MVNTLTAKTIELEEELKATGLWQPITPGWVHVFDENDSLCKKNFAEWLQFIFIPNHLHKNKFLPLTDKNFMVLHALRFFGDDVKKGKLLQILIEIDALL